MRQALLLLPAVLLLALPLACSLGANADAPKVGDKVIDFELKALTGATVKTADLRKDKVFLLKFGATWCGWCNKQIPHLNKVEAEYAGKVAVLDVDVREDGEKVSRHNKANGVTYTTVLDPDGAVAAKYGVSGIPVVIIADKEGKIAYRGYYTTFDALKKVIDGLLK